MNNLDLLLDAGGGSTRSLEQRIEKGYHCKSCGIPAHPHLPAGDNVCIPSGVLLTFEECYCIVEVFIKFFHRTLLSWVEPKQEAPRTSGIYIFLINTIRKASWGHPPQGTKHVMQSRIEEKMKRTDGGRSSRATASVPGESGTSKHESKECSSDMTRRSEESRLEKKFTELMGEWAPVPEGGKPSGKDLSTEQRIERLESAVKVVDSLMQ